MIDSVMKIKMIKIDKMIKVIKIQYRCSTQNRLDMERGLAFLNWQIVVDGPSIAVTFLGK